MAVIEASARNRQDEFGPFDRHRVRHQKLVHGVGPPYPVSFELIK